ncbi:MAG TPA: iron-sulfur cluster insertion protein ErpA [bacterium]|nr:iron-sulfur cluster insertion protein ErpA [bacterium]
MITVTDRAVSKLKELLAEQDESNLYFRVFITRGGCDGFSYGMTFDSAPEADDQVIDRGDVRVLVDKASLRLLDGSEIDYVTSVAAEGFAIRNPNAVRTCGCGHSFQTRDEVGEAKPCGEEADART